MSFSDFCGLIFGQVAAENEQPRRKRTGYQKKRELIVRVKLVYALP